MAYSCFLRLLSGLACGLACAVAFAAPVAGGKIRFDIPRQELADSLHEFSRQTGHHLLYPSQIIAGAMGRALFGFYTVEEGLAKLLQGSGLEFVVDGRGSIAIRPERGLPVPRPQAGESAPAQRSESERVPSDWIDAAIAEVIVTARRRDESLQQAPVAVTAIDSQAIEARSIHSTEDLNAWVPGVAVNGGNFFGRTSGAFRVRGIPGVAFYVDGVVRSGAAGLLMNVVEIERMEVLRGPQGTTFGKNAIGGAIQYITEKPRERAGVRLKTSVGSHSRQDLTANIDIPLSERLLTKLTAATFNRDGYVESTTAGVRLGDQQDRVARFDLLWRPADRLEALFIGEYAEQNSNGTPATVWALNSVCPGDPEPENFVGVAPNSLCIYENIGLPVDRQWMYGARGQWKTAAGAGLGNTYSSLGGILQVDWRVNDRLEFKSISGHRKIDAFRDHDFDGTPYALYQAFSGVERDESSQEFQLLYSDARLSGTAGLYYYADESWSSRQNWVANELRFAPYLSLRTALGGGYAEYQPPIINSLTHEDSEGWAVFSEWTYRLTDKLALSAGARYNDEDISQAAHLPAYALPEQCCAPTESLRPAGPPLPTQSGSATFTELSPRFSLHYQWSRQAMIYYTYAEGFGAGGFTGGAVPFLPNGGFRPYGPETLKNHEWGLRTDLFSGRLRFNATGFYGVYDNIQISEEVQQAPGFPLITNAGEARIRGVEIEGVASPSDALTVNYSASWLDAEYTDIGQAQNLVLDAPFAYAPDFSYALGAQYTWPVLDGAALTLRADYVWQDEVFTTPDINTRSRQRAYGVANARLSFRDRSGRWEVAFAGRNVLNELYRLNGFFLPADQIDTGTPARPREWMLSVRYSTP